MNNIGNTMVRHVEVPRPNIPVCQLIHCEYCIPLPFSNQMNMCYCSQLTVSHSDVQDELKNKTLWLLFYVNGESLLKYIESDFFEQRKKCPHRKLLATLTDDKVKKLIRLSQI